MVCRFWCTSRPFRQLNLLRIRAELQRRGVTRAALDIPAGKPWEASSLVVDATPILRGSSQAPLGHVLEKGHMACALRLPGLAGVLGMRTQPGLTVAHEIAERVRVIACLLNMPNGSLSVSRKIHATWGLPCRTS